MAFRIFDHLLIHHGWIATGRLVVCAAAQGSASSQAARPNQSPPAQQCRDIERRALLARLVYRGKHVSLLCRAARRLQADPSLSIEQLASELGVSGESRSRGLRAALGQGADRLFR